jgi:hypothetical protein
MSHFEYVVDEPLRARRRRLLRRTKPIPHSIARSEWDPAPLGRLGRLLWDDIDRYLEFVEIARAEPRRALPATSQSPPPTYLWFV